MRTLGIFSIFAGYLDQGSEVILMEPFFDQYIVSQETKALAYIISLWTVALQVILLTI